MRSIQRSQRGRMIPVQDQNHQGSSQHQKYSDGQDNPCMQRKSLSDNLRMFLLPDGSADIGDGFPPDRKTQAADYDQPHRR